MTSKNDENELIKKYEKICSDSIEFSRGIPLLVIQTDILNRDKEFINKSLKKFNFKIKYYDPSKKYQTISFDESRDLTEEVINQYQIRGRIRELKRHKLDVLKELKYFKNLYTDSTNEYAIRRYDDIYQIYKNYENRFNETEEVRTYIELWYNEFLENIKNFDINQKR